MDEAGKLPSRVARDLLAQFVNHLQTEIKLAEPDLVVFFTGPNYDEALLSTFPEVEPAEIIPNFLSELRFPTHEQSRRRKWFRTEHHFHLRT